jgi:hypothetical protein
VKDNENDEMREKGKGANKLTGNAKKLRCGRHRLQWGLSAFIRVSLLNVLFRLRAYFAESLIAGDEMRKNGRDLVKMDSSVGLPQNRG